MKSDNSVFLENSNSENELLRRKENSVKNRGILFILSGPSGVGKGTIRKAVMELGNLSFSVSCTTRTPRAGEIDGVDYKFISLEEFNEKLDESLFLEHALVHSNMYGTLRRDVESVLESGEDMILEIDVQGAFQVKSKMDCVSVFVLPPSLQALEDRLRSRRADDDEKIKLRIKNAENEISRAKEFDYSIINDSLEHAVSELKSIIINNRNILRRV
jgi:guanylate kinase